MEDPLSGLWVSGPGTSAWAGICLRVAVAPSLALAVNCPWEAPLRSWVAAWQRGPSPPLAAMECPLNGWAAQGSGVAPALAGRRRSVGRGQLSGIATLLACSAKVAAF